MIREGSMCWSLREGSMCWSLAEYGIGFWRFGLQCETVIKTRRGRSAGAGSIAPPQGGIDLERGYGDVRPWRPPFHASPATRKGPISVSSQDPILRKFGNFCLYRLNFHPNFSSQAPKFGNFQLTNPPFSEANVSLQAPHFGNPGRKPLPDKKLSAPPPPGLLPGNDKKIWGNHDISVNGIWREILLLEENTSSTPDFWEHFFRH